MLHSAIQFRANSNVGSWSGLSCTLMVSGFYCGLACSVLVSHPRFCILCWRLWYQLMSPKPDRKKIQPIKTQTCLMLKLVPRSFTKRVHKRVVIKGEGVERTKGWEGGYLSSVNGQWRWKGDDGRGDKREWRQSRNASLASAYPFSHTSNRGVWIKVWAGTTFQNSL